MRVPCSFKEVRNVNGIHVGYRCLFHLLITETPDSVMPVRADVFTSIADLIDNRQLAIDCGVSASQSSFSIIVDEHNFPDLYNKIKAYKSYVSHSNLHR